jgi:phosphoserine aminotransferase
MSTANQKPGTTEHLRRTHNFNAGPAVLPLPVLEQAQAELLDYGGTGMSILEMSHRSPAFESLMQETENNLRGLLGLTPEFKVLFLQGGASLQFGMVPMNLRPAGTSADYTVNGTWGKAAVKDAQKLGLTSIAGSSEATGFDRVPEALDLDPKAAYLHFTSNETIHGVQWPREPQPAQGVPLVCDMSSDFLSRPIDAQQYALIYAGAQKNAGPAGVTVVILREDLLERVPSGLPVMLDYKVQVAGGSMHNTPPCFAIYIVGLVFKWLQAQGGLPGIAQRNKEKAGLIYSAIDASGGFYTGHAIAQDRSTMNVTFRLPNEELEEQFARQAASEGMVGLKGHRSVGGMRASLYNALPLESAGILAQFMGEFQRKNG